MTQINLKQVILDELEMQRNDLLNFSNFPIELYSKEDIEQYEDDIEAQIFGEDDILDQALSSLDITCSDIDPDDFRDYQHETVRLCVDKFTNLIESK
jgi:hypothetical protein